MMGIDTLTTAIDIILATIITIIIITGIIPVAVALISEANVASDGTRRRTAR